MLYDIKFIGAGVVPIKSHASYIAHLNTNQTRDNRLSNHSQLATNDGARCLIHSSKDSLISLSTSFPNDPFFSFGSFVPLWPWNTISKRGRVNICSSAALSMNNFKPSTFEAYCVRLAGVPFCAAAAAAACTKATAISTQIRECTPSRIPGAARNSAVYYLASPSLTAR